MIVKYLTSPQSGQTQLGLKIWQVHKVDRPYEGYIFDKSTRVDGSYESLKFDESTKWTDLMRIKYLASL